MTESSGLSVREANLKKANEVRQGRSSVRHRLAGAPSKEDALLWAAEVLVSPPSELAGVRVVELLCWCRLVGRQTAVRLVHAAEAELRCQLLEREIGRLTHRQASGLARTLEGSAR